MWKTPQPTMWPPLFVYALFAAAAVLGVVEAAVAGPLCDRSLNQTTPKTKTDGRFRLSIVGDPSHYQPSETYTVRLAGKKTGQLAPRFIGFSLAVEAATGAPGLRPAPDTGTLVLFGDAFTRFADDCHDVVTHSTLSPKSEVQVMWTAPEPGNGCLIFKATLVEEPGLWYQDDHPLSVTLCEPSNNGEEETAINRQCCACDEAKYEMTFEGLWSRHTHPKDFPTNVTATRFSDVIGASHTLDYRFWEYGGIASEGLKQVAEKGNTRVLESELKSQSQHIRTIIKARGISYPNVTGKTFAVFRVDNKHHLISLVSMIDPSPDWIVGVSAFELCLRNCSWLENREINLYPWDAGTDSGITYTSPDIPTEPRDHIRRITSSFPSDPASPFYDKSGEEMKPLAKLYLTRQRLYEKSCSENIGEPRPYEGCELGPWGEWSPCSVTCGIGKKMKQRNIISNNGNCGNAELSRRATCFMPKCLDRLAPGMEVGWNDDHEQDPQCATTPWSPWSGCSVTCGKGERHRFRNLLNRKTLRFCSTPGKKPILQEDQECIGEMGPICPEPDEEATGNSVDSYEPLPWTSPVEDDDLLTCEVAEWSRYSACSVSCGHGVRVRTRKLKEPLDPDARQRCLDRIKLNETIQCSDIPECRLTPNQARDDVNEGKSPSEQIEFGGLDSHALYRHTIYPVIGSDGPVIDCKVSSWSEWSDCSVTCSRGLMQRTRIILTHAKNGGKACPKKLLRRRRCNLGPCPGSRRLEDGHDEYEDDDSSVVKDDCVYGEWGPWTKCSTTCGSNGLQQRTRAVDLDATPIPAYCTDRLETRICHQRPCRIYHHY